MRHSQIKMAAGLGTAISDSSQIFFPFRAVGFVSNHVPFFLEVKGTEHFITTVVGESFHIYNGNKLNLVFAGEALNEPISAVVSRRNLQVVSAGCNVHILERGKTKRKYIEHTSPIHLLLQFGDYIISADNGNTVNVWELETLETHSTLLFDECSFFVTSIVHPSTYLNKVLLGSKQGTLQLWNARTNTMLYEFAGWNSTVLVLEQAPTVDVVAIGLKNGQIILHNIKFDKVLMTFCQEDLVTAISFRTDGPHVMASGSLSGHVFLWNLEKRQACGMIADAHVGCVSGLQFYHKQPLLITSGIDNSLKVWVFDNSDGTGRLLKQRTGHSAPPTRILFYGSYGNTIFTSGLDQTLRCTSLMRGDQCHELTQGSIIRKAKKSAMKVEQLRLPIITCIDAEISREHDWDNIVTCHSESNAARTWNSRNLTLGKHKFVSQSKRKTPATCCHMTSCGNFTVIGYKDGLIEKFNMQSGQHRTTYGSEEGIGHTSTVRGLCVDNTNMKLVSASADKTIKFWGFKKGKLLHTLPCDVPIMQMRLHRESSLLAVSFDDFTLKIVDIDTTIVVRLFSGHSNIIMDMSWSSDARWLITSSMDGTIKTWEVPSSRLIDCFLVENPATSVAFSPSGEFLVTTHQDLLGIYLWSNKVIYSGVNPSPLPDDFQPAALKLPATKFKNNDCAEEETESAEEMISELSRSENDIYESPDQLDASLLTLSLLPMSRWLNFANIELIKERNKPKQPPKKPKSAPFFLQGNSLLQPTNDEAPVESRVIDAKLWSHEESKLRELLLPFDEKNVDAVFSFLKSLSPVAVDMHMRMLNGAEEVGSFIRFLTAALGQRKDFEVVNAYITLCLKIHGSLVLSSDELRLYADNLLTSLTASWSECETLIGQSLSLVKYFKSATI